MLRKMQFHEINGKLVFFQVVEVLIIFNGLKNFKYFKMKVHCQIEYLFIN